MSRSSNIAAEELLFGGFSLERSTSMAAMSFVQIVSWEWLTTINSRVHTLKDSVQHT